MAGHWLAAGLSGVALAGVLVACAPEEPRLPSGEKLFAKYCVDCHGVSGTGNGPAAASLPKKPADLTRIAARNGGVFPTARVMSTIDGYTRKGDGTIMPELGPELQRSKTVMFDTGDGVPTPTPAALVALAEYLRSIQQP